MALGVGRVRSRWWRPRNRGGIVRTTLRWTLIPGAFMVLACQDRRPSEDLRNDLALVDAGRLELAPAMGANATVVSAAEKVNVPGPKPVATPTRKRAPKAPPPVEAEAAASADQTVTAPEIVTVAASESPTAIDEPAPESAPAVRPQPIEPQYPVGGGTIYGTGRDGRTGGGSIGVVIRGGRTGDDLCELHDRARDRRGGRPGVGILINNRVPGSTTFPRR